MYSERPINKHHFSQRDHGSIFYQFSSRLIPIFFFQSWKKIKIVHDDRAWPGEFFDVLSSEKSLHYGPKIYFLWKKLILDFCRFAELSIWTLGGLSAPHTGCIFWFIFYCKFSLNFYCIFFQKMTVSFLRDWLWVLAGSTSKHFSN